MVNTRCPNGLFALFDGHKRAAFIFFESPIYTGIFAASTIPWLYFWATPVPATPFRPLRHLPAPLLELALIVVLAATGSRGATLVLVYAYLLLLLLAERVQSSRGTKIRIGIALLLVCSVSLLGGFSHRFTDPLIQVDGSIHNRIQVWRSARDLPLLQPWSGFGGGMAGIVYSQ